MKFQTKDENDIHWLRDLGGYEVADVVRKLKDAGKWDEFLAREADADGVVDCDALYDRLRHEPREALASVGLHEVDATATPLEVVAAWGKDADVVRGGLHVSYAADGKTPSGLQLYDYGGSIGVCLEFESVNEDGEVDEESLGVDEVVAVMQGRTASPVDAGEWTCTDVAQAKFEMWKSE